MALKAATEVRNLLTQFISNLVDWLLNIYTRTLAQTQTLAQTNAHTYTTPQHLHTCTYTRTHVHIEFETLLKI